MVLLAALAMLAYESGKPPAETTSPKFVHSVLITIMKPAVAIPLVSLLVLVLTALIRALLVRRDGDQARPASRGRSHYVLRYDEYRFGPS
jgi:hypothetical protein